MPTQVEALLEQAVQVGLLHDDLRTARAGLPADKRDSTLAVLTELVRRGKLTKFQAETILKGKVKALLLGNYILQDLLGQGGMGVVYRARHTMMERTAAVKLLPATLKGNTESVHRFLREVKAAAQLEHPSIVQAYDAGSVNGRYFLAMEYVPGVTLDKLVQQRGQLPVSTAVDYVVQAAGGLAYAHQRGIVHRDIKPANLILGPKNRVRILDMGLACLADEQADRRAQLTAVDTSLGTTDFMAPEQALELRKADGRSDIYSLGCVLYFLLYGKVLFAGVPRMARVLAHQQKQPESLCAGRSDVPLKLDAVYQRMLAKDPEERYASMAEALADLEACLQSGAVTEKPTKRAPAMESRESPEEPESRSRSRPRRAPVQEKPSRMRAKILAISAAACVLTFGAALVGGYFLRSANNTDNSGTAPKTGPAFAQRPNTPSPIPVVPPPSPKSTNPVNTVGPVLAYDFRDANNGGIGFRDSLQYPVNQANYSFFIFCRNKRNNQEGFHFEAVADATVTGPDGRPGTLCFTVGDLPNDTSFFGFSFRGRGNNGDVRIGHWRPGGVGQSELRELTLSYHYKSARSWGFRLEPLNDPYNNRLDFGRLAASPQWTKFSKRLSEGTNVDTFLKNINASPDPTPNLKFTWANSGADYESGDTLLITDLRIERRKD